ncbi:MAG: site-specific integrase [bacterium]|nr:site-specific integrase [bacterium]
MASIEKRHTKQGIRYRARITLKGQPRLSETFATRREATRWAERTTEALRSRRFRPESEAERRTMGDLVDRYIRDKVPQLARTQPNRRNLEWWADQLGRDTRLSQITPASIASARDILATGKGLSGKPLSPSTVRRYLTVLGSAMGTATKEWFWMDDNPCTKVRRPTEPRGRVRCLDGDERQRLLAACKESTVELLYPLVVMALCTGARRGELLSLMWQDVDLDRGVAIIHHSKNGERRSLAVTGLAASVLREWRVRHLGSDPVFPGRCGKATFPHKAWQAALETAEIEEFRFHDLRHTFASYLAMSGATLAELAEALGHKTLAMVKRYAHLTEGHTMNVIASMTERFLAA